MQSSRIHVVSFFLLGSILVLAGAACKDSTGDALSHPPDEAVTETGDGRLRVHLRDSHLDGAEAINVTITEVIVHGGGGKPQVVRNTPVAFNLLELTGPKLLDLIDTPLAPGTYTMNLIFAEGSTIVVKAQTYPLKTPSSTTAGWKVRGEPFSIEAGKSTWIMLDFDPEKSVTWNRGRGYSLKPVVETVSVASLLPKEEQQLVDVLGPAVTASMLEEAEIVFQGVVKSKTVAFDNNIYGSSQIYSFLTFQIQDTIKGTVAVPNAFPLRVIGGKVGNVELLASHMPTFEVGDNNILFLKYFSNILGVVRGDLGSVPISK